MPCHFYFCPEPPDSFLLPYCEAKEHNRLRGNRTTLLEADSKAQMRSVCSLVGAHVNVWKTRGPREIPVQILLMMRHYRQVEGQ